MHAGPSPIVNACVNVCVCVHMLMHDECVLSLQLAELSVVYWFIPAEKGVTGHRLLKLSQDDLTKIGVRCVGRSKASWGCMLHVLERREDEV